MQPTRAELLSVSRRLLYEARRYARLAEDARDCLECCPESERGLLREAAQTHSDLMAQHGLPYAFTLFRGSALHLPLLRRMVHHYGFHPECDVCQGHKAVFSHALEHVKTAPNDVDFVTVGIPHERAGDLLALAKSLHVGHGILDVSAHLTDRQLKNPRHTYSSYFNLENMNIPSNPADVNPVKLARHFASVAWYCTPTRWLLPTLAALKTSASCAPPRNVSRAS